MKNSYASVIENLKEVCELRPQVMSVDDGRELEFDIDKDVLFPRVFIKTVNSEYNGRWEYEFELLCLERINNDLSNLIDAMSLTKSILEDIISELNYQNILDPIGVICEPIYAFQDAQSSGWRVPITLFTDKGLECHNEIGD
ncbi:hypothetical protein AMJ86_00845 [bacterium SM23_57]|nr:MAG: hypothetical protein AMJ86_00845 [bacterium SM23_57]